MNLSRLYRWKGNNGLDVADVARTIRIVKPSFPCREESVFRYSALQNQKVVPHVNTAAVIHRLFSGMLLDTTLPRAICGTLPAASGAARHRWATGLARGSSRSVPSHGARFRFNSRGRSSLERPGLLD